ncbi:MAG: hypothetical protein WD070_04955 [Pirellulaceae bacterium]
MPIVSDIEALESRILTELDAVHDFTDHTNVVWRSFQHSVRKGLKIKWTNIHTGNSATEQDLVKLAQRYNSHYLLEFTFQHFVNLHEVFVFDLLRLLLVNDTRHLKLDRKVDVRTALAAPDIPTLVGSIASRELNDLAYKPVGDWFKRLHEIVSIRCPTEDEQKQLVEIKASRDVLVHNAGVANAVYFEKAGDKARYKEGEQLEIPGDYHRDSWLLVKKVVADLSLATKAKLGP